MCIDQLMDPFDDAPIGVFDSGVGGLSILSACLRNQPNESYLYIADSAYAPYGDKNDETIRDRVLQIVSYLIQQGAKAVVIACNTGTAAAVKECREIFSLPIIGVEPGVKPAIKMSKSKRVGVLATQYTVNSLKFQRLVSELKPHANSITALGCPGLVELIENPNSSNQALRSLLQPYIEQFEAADIDTLALGCTHYGFVEKEISGLFKKPVHVIDTSVSIALEIERRLSDQNLLSHSSQTGRVEILTTGRDSHALFALSHRLIQYKGDVSPVEVTQ